MVRKGDEVLISHSGTDPHFGASSERVYYLGKKDKDERVLRSAQLTGHQEREHVVSAEATSFRVSPNERWIAWQEGYHVWVSPLCAGRTYRLGPKSERAHPSL